MLIEQLKTDYEYQDGRGMLAQLIHKGYSQVNVVASKAGVTRGGHYHKLNTEAYYMVQGSCRVTAYNKQEKETGIYRAGDFFRIGPYIAHDFDYLEDSVLVTMYSMGVELGNGVMDIYPAEAQTKDKGIV